MTFALKGAGFAPRRPNLLARLGRRLDAIVARPRTHKALVRLDDRTLRDIGVSRDEIDQAIRRLDRGLEPLPRR